MSTTATAALRVSSTSHNADDNPPPKPVNYLQLLILSSHVGVYAPPPEQITSDALARSTMMAGPPDTTLGSDFLCLLSGTLDDFLHYSRQEMSQWLIDVAHDICDPSLKHGSLQVWDADREMWRGVNGTDALTASTYLYQVQTVISLTKISGRRGRSITDFTGDASTMARHVKQRDRGECWVTRIDQASTNSHVVPKRMGDHLLRVVYDTFVSTPRPTLSIYDQICGITLSGVLDPAFDTYRFGLRLVAPGVYECHSFVPPSPKQGWRMTIFGGGTHLPATFPDLHGHRINPPRPEHVHNPPPGLLRWHYIQCVIRKFASPDYKSLQNVYHYEFPLPLRGDPDEENPDEGNPDEGNPDDEDTDREHESAACGCGCVQMPLFSSAQLATRLAIHHIRRRASLVRNRARSTQLPD